MLRDLMLSPRAAAVEFQLKQTWGYRHSVARDLDRSNKQRRALEEQVHDLQERLHALDAREGVAAEVSAARRLWNADE